MLKGYVGKLLRVDLTARKTQDEDMPAEKILRSYLGGVGLGVKFLSDEVSPTVKPYDPENRLMVMSGPLTGTPAPAASNCTFVSINAETGFTVGSAHTHGFFAPKLKFAGYDGIIIQGISDRPVYLWIQDGHVEIRDAGNVWGKDTHDSEDVIKHEVGEPRASVAAIGPAGEAVIAGACVANDKHHIAASGGMGAVMGSKRLKAIAVYGKKPVPLARPMEFREVAKEWKTPERLKTMTGCQHAGMPRIWYKLGESSILAGKNLSSAEFGREVGAKFVEECKKFKIAPKACYGCPLACAYTVHVATGPHKGETFTMSGGGENLEGAAAMIGVTDAGTIFWLVDRYDRLGFGTSTTGTAISLAFECYEKGLLTKKDTDGLELTWGNAEAAARLLDKIIAREGIGKILADGPKKAAEAIGGDAPKYAVHMKGVGFNLHDWRAKWQTFLGQAVAGAGPRWEGKGMDAFGFEPDLGYNEAPPPFTMEGAAEAVSKMTKKKLYEDSVGVCWFVCQNVPQILSLASRSLMTAIGWEDITGEELLSIGERIANEERVFNMGRGLTIADDLDVGQRMLEPPSDGVARGKTIAPYLKDAVMEYYRLMGWEGSTGKPLPQTLSRLGLEHLIKRIY